MLAVTGGPSPLGLSPDYPTTMFHVEHSPARRTFRAYDNPPRFPQEKLACPCAVDATPLWTRARERLAPTIDYFLGGVHVPRGTACSRICVPRGTRCAVVAR